MKQILQNLASGETLLADVPAPHAKRGQLLIETKASLISIGTERMLVSFARANLLDKARQQPERVIQVLQKIKTDGFLATLDVVRSRLDQPLPLGYSSAGIVVAVGADVDEFQVGDRVASNGPHAELVVVPQHLCAKIPDAVSFDAAAFTVVGAIALQGVRLIAPTLGEVVVVSGLGLIGLLAVQILRAHGCRVIGVDFDSRKCEIARAMGAETVDLSQQQDPVEVAASITRGRGVDAVLLAAATDSDEPVHQAAQMCRQRGRIVLVGSVGLQLKRDDFYRKEISFQVSCSYGPGRYDRAYEAEGHDYPFGLVRWTEQRNLEAVLELIADGRIDTAPLLTESIPIARALDAYARIEDARALGLVLQYDGQGEADKRVPTVRVRPASQSAPREPVIAVVGAGNFAQFVIGPALQRRRSRIKAVVSAGGVTGTHFARKFGAESSTTDYQSVLQDEEINAVFIATRPDVHAAQVSAALRAGKRVFVEKPLCLTTEELVSLRTQCAAMPSPFLMVGFNRRFAPHVAKLKEMLDNVREPKTYVMTVNAGAIPGDSWHQDHDINGPRVISEGCHWVDLLRFLTGAPIVEAGGSRVGSGSMAIVDDKMSVTLGFADGSIGTIHYFANGHKSFPKERLTVFTAGRVVELDNFRRMRAYGWPGFRTMSLFRQDKGHDAEIQATLDAMREGRPAPIPLDEVFEVTQATLDAYDAASSSR